VTGGLLATGTGGTPAVAAGPAGPSLAPSHTPPGRDRALHAAGHGRGAGLGLVTSNLDGYSDGATVAVTAGPGRGHRVLVTRFTGSALRHWQLSDLLQVEPCQ
jgi:hypothetical protein